MKKRRESWKRLKERIFWRSMIEWRPRRSWREKKKIDWQRNFENTNLNNNSEPKGKYTSPLHPLTFLANGWIQLMEKLRTRCRKRNGTKTKQRTHHPRKTWIYQGPTLQSNHFYISSLKKERWSLKLPRRSSGTKLDS